MFSQFFGSYLLRREAITPDELTQAINDMGEAHIKLGTLAIHNGLMVASEVDEVCYIQSREDKRFGEIAIERGYLTEDQVREMLSSQIPDYLLLGQCLVDRGYITNNDLEAFIIDYQSETEIVDMDYNDDQNEKIQGLIERFFMVAEIPVSDYSIMYMNLLFNNLIRLIGEDFTPLSPIPCTEYPINYCVGQALHGKIHCISRMDMLPDVAIEFASRFANEEFDEFDEYVQASLEDFVNLHNGLFIVNMSNTHSIELTLDPPIVEENELLEMSESTFMIPIVYPFGTIHLLVSLYGDE